MLIGGGAHVGMMGGRGGWDISNAAYSFISTSVASQVSFGQGMAFGDSGTKLYVLDHGSNTIYQYTLSTAWDISTKSYASKSLNVFDQNSDPRDVAISADGTKIYMTGTSGGDRVYQYTLSTPWDLATASYASKSADISSQNTDPDCAIFSPDGTKMYVLGRSGSATIYQYTLGTPWDVSTYSYDSKSLNVSSEAPGAVGFAISPTGEKLFVLDDTSDIVKQYTLVTAWDMSTGSYDIVNKSVFDQTSNAQAIAFSSSGMLMFVMSTQVIYQYDL
jgi:DNA-binding beta-propeller fold protein YncE